MNKSFFNVLKFLHRHTVAKRLETGFSMLEAVVVVGVLLALAIGGFVSYGTIVENAKLAAVRSAASQLHTGAVTASFDSDSSTDPQKVMDQWNSSTNKIFGEILSPKPGETSANGDYCVQATHRENTNIKARSGACDGIPDLDKDTDGDGVPDVSDPDIDGDGIPNADDSTPYGDGTSNNGGNNGNNNGGNGGNENGSGNTNVTPVDYSYSGKLAVWGNGEEGLLANGYYMWMNYPGSNQAYVGPLTEFRSSQNILNNKTVTSIDAANEHACAIADGIPYCWGSNTYGELGRGTVDPNWWDVRGTPEPVVMTGELAGKTFSKIVVSDAGLSCGISDGTAYCWGYNDMGQTGTGLSDENVLIPTKVVGGLVGKRVTDIESKGWGQSVCAIAEGEVYCWGDNYLGQLGNGGTDPNPLPAKVGGLLTGKTATKLSMSLAYGAVCVIADGKAYCWGHNWNGELGAGMNFPGQIIDRWDYYAVTPIAVNTNAFPANAVVTDIAFGYNHACAAVSGKAYCWGNDDNNFKDYGQLGRGAALVGESPLPQPVVLTGSPMEGKTVTSVAAGDSSSYAVADGKVYGWGGDWAGQLHGPGDDVYIPILVDKGDINGKTVKKIVATWETIFAVYAE